MISKYFNPYTDFGFKKLFGEEANKDLLMDFLNQLLPERHQIAQLSFKNTENMSDTQAERKSIFDIYCESQTGLEFEPIFQKGFEIAEVSHLSSEQYDAYLRSRLSYNEAKAITDTAFYDGEKKGRIEGRIEIGKAMLTEGFDVATIAKITQLTQKEVGALK
ncbi:MAG: PD-(D/E)XK nuclease family transposase [Methylobacter sp.]